MFMLFDQPDWTSTLCTYIHLKCLSCFVSTLPLSKIIHNFLPHTRMRKGVKQLVLPVCQFVRGICHTHHRKAKHWVLVWNWPHSLAVICIVIARLAAVLDPKIWLSNRRDRVTLWLQGLNTQSHSHKSIRH